MNGRIVGIVGLAATTLATLPACGTATTTTAAPRRPSHPLVAAGPVPGFDRADLVAFDEREGLAIFYALGAHGVEETGRVAIGHSGAGDAGWLGRDALYVNGDDHEIYRITATGVTLVPVPSADGLALPAESTDGYSGEVDWEQLAVDDSGAWWGRCPYGVSGDYGRCDRWLWIAVDGTTRHEQGGDRGRTYELPEARPTDYRVVENTVDGRTGTVTCTGHDGLPVTLDGGYGWDIIGVRWVSADPPGLLIESGYKAGTYYDHDEIMHWELHDGCGAARATGTTLEAGPGGVWVGYPGNTPWDGQPVLFRGADRLGELPAGQGIRFRPPT